MSSRPERKAAAPPDRHRLMQAIGHEVVLFQEASTAFDGLAAEILAVNRHDLPCLTLLLFGGPATVDQLTTALKTHRAGTVATVERLQLAGYARRRAGVRGGVELTGHARSWIERIWGPLREEGGRLMNRYTTRDLDTLSTFMHRARAVQEAAILELREWLAVPASPARRPHLRGGLSPAALRRVQLFVEANLGESIRLGDLAARAGLSAFHFARAFRTSTGLSPRAFVESRRIEQAKRLLAESHDPLSDIAVRSGFTTQSRFTTTFKRSTGFTPAEYRRGSD